MTSYFIKDMIYRHLKNKCVYICVNVYSDSEKIKERQRTAEKSGRKIYKNIH